MYPRYTSLYEVYEYGNQRLRLHQRQEEGDRKHPRHGRGVWKLSVSKERSESRKSCEQRTNVRVPRQSEKEGEWLVFSGHRIGSILGLYAEVRCQASMHNVYSG